MGLGNRDARAQHDRGVTAANSAAQWTFEPGQRVMTCDGFPGTVAAVEDGPYAGSEEYRVVLDNGMGGGAYTTGQLSSLRQDTASFESTAIADYPELADVLVDRPDIAPNIVSTGTRRSDPHCPECQQWHDVLEDAYDTKDEGPVWQQFINHVKTHDTTHPVDRPGSRLYGSQRHSEGTEPSPEGGDPGFDSNGHLTWDGQAPQGETDDYSALGVPKSAHLDYDDPDHDESDHMDPAGQQSLPGMPHPADDHCEYCGSGNHSSGEHEDEPYEDDAFISHRGDASMGGKHLGNGRDTDNPHDHAHLLIEREMQSQGHYPNIWDENGNQCHEHHINSVHDALKAEHPLLGAEHPCPECGAAHERQQDATGHDPGNGPATDHLNRCQNCNLTYDPCDYHDEEVAAPGWGRSHPSDHDPHGWSMPQTDKDQYGRNYEEEDPFTPRPIRPEDTVNNINDVLKGTGHEAAFAPSFMTDVCKHCGVPIKPRDMGDGYVDEGRQTGSYEPNHLHEPIGTDAEYAFLDSNPTGPTKFSGLSVYAMLVDAAADADFRFEITASWSDVRRKAKRLRTTGQVTILAATEGIVTGVIKGDHFIYETQIQRLPGKTAVAVWQCGCKWAAYAWGRSPQYARFEGRMCSHALALHYEAQSRGMFGREIQEDTSRPKWLKSYSPVVIQYDKDKDKNLTRRAVPPGNMRTTFGSLDFIAHCKPDGYMYDADVHCAHCAKQRFGEDDYGHVADHAEDSEGNSPHPIISNFGDETDPHGENCGTCGDKFTEPYEHEIGSCGHDPEYCGRDQMAHGIEHESRCPACGEPTEYCRGHGESGDPEGHHLLEMHDEGDHSLCHPEGCDESGRGRPRNVGPEFHHPETLNLDTADSSGRNYDQPDPFTPRPITHEDAGNTLDHIDRTLRGESALKIGIRQAVSWGDDPAAIAIAMYAAGVEAPGLWLQASYDENPIYPDQCPACGGPTGQCGGTSQMGYGDHQGDDFAEEAINKHERGDHSVCNPYGCNDAHDLEGHPQGHDDAMHWHGVQDYDDASIASDGGPGGDMGDSPLSTINTGDPIAGDANSGLSVQPYEHNSPTYQPNEDYSWYPPLKDGSSSYFGGGIGSTGMLDDEFMFEAQMGPVTDLGGVPQPGSLGGAGVQPGAQEAQDAEQRMIDEKAPARSNEMDDRTNAGAYATFNQVPEPALPMTDGDGVPGPQTMGGESNDLEQNPIVNSLSPNGGEDDRIASRNPIKCLHCGTDLHYGEVYPGLLDGRGWPQHGDGHTHEAADGSTCPSCGREGQVTQDHRGVFCPQCCTGALGSDGQIAHDAETCPVHENMSTNDVDSGGRNYDEPDPFSHHGNQVAFGDPNRTYPPQENNVSTANDSDLTADLADTAVSASFVHQFQASASWLTSPNKPVTGSTGNMGDNDIAAAAREFLAKTALKEFTLAEQAALINEGEGVTAANLDRLMIEGTHYEALEAALAAEDDDPLSGLFD